MRPWGEVSAPEMAEQDIAGIEESECQAIDAGCDNVLAGKPSSYSRGDASYLLGVSMSRKNRSRTWLLSL